MERYGRLQQVKVFITSVLFHWQDDTSMNMDTLQLMQEHWHWIFLRMVMFGLVTLAEHSHTLKATI